MYHTFAKKGPWAVHLTLRDGPMLEVSVSQLDATEHPGTVYVLI